MAPRITGSANREKRKAQSSNRPVTQGQNPQRSNRQGVSQATVSNGGTRGNTSASVTMGRGGKPASGTARVTGAPAPKALPYSKPGTGGPRLLPGSQNVQPQARPAQPGTSRPTTPTRAQAATDKAAQAAKGSTSTNVRVGQPQKGTTLGRIGANSLKGQAAEGAIYAALKPLSDVAGQYLGTRLGEGLRPVGRRIDDLLPGVNSKDEAKRIKAKTPLRTMTPAERAKAVRLTQATGNEPRTKSTPTLKAATSTRSNRASSQGSSGSSMSRSTPKPPAKAQPGQSKDMNENYQMWAKANPTLAAKVKSNQAGYNAIGKDAVAGVGPVKDGSSYKPQAEKPSEMNAGAVRRAALTASADSVTEPKIAQTPNKKKKVNG